MNLTVLISAIGLLSVLSTLYMGVDLWRKRQASSSTDVVSSAVQLLKPYRVEVTELRSELAAANTTISIFKDKLISAEFRAGQLNEQLEAASTELNYLRVQVRAISRQIREEEGQT